MTLQSSGTISLQDIIAEFGLASNALFPTAFYGLGGAPSSGTLGFHDFYGRSSVPPYPSAPTFFAANTYSNSSTTLSMAWPASHAVDDVAFLVIHSNNQSIATPSGWSLVVGSAGSGSAAGVGGTRIGVFWQRATSTSMAATTVADSGNITGARMFVFRGCKATGVPYEALSTNNSSSTGTTATWGNSNYLTGINRTYVGFLTAARDVNSTANFASWANSSTSGLTEIGDDATLTSNGGAIGAAYGSLTSQTNTGTATTTIASSVQWNTVCLALIPEGIPASGMSPEASSTGVNDGGTGTSCSYTITAPSSVVWNWSVILGATGLTSDVTNGGSASSITFTLTAGASPRTSIVQITQGNYTWNIQLDTEIAGGGGVVVSVTPVGVGVAVTIP